MPFQGCASFGGVKMNFSEIMSPTRNASHYSSVDLTS